MKWLLNMKVAGKLLLLVIPFVATLIAFLFFFAIRTNEINSDSKKALYDEAFVSTAAILNADRDFYQAAIAEQEWYLRSDELTSEESDALIAAYDENAAQVYDRISSALENVSGNAELYSNYAHEATGLTLEQLKASFLEHYTQWQSLYDHQARTGDMAQKTAVFEQAREEINVMTEILESYANHRSGDITQSVQSSLTVSICIIAGIITLLSGLAVYLILSIRGRVRYVTKLSRQIAQGDLSVEADKKNLTKDEIGQLTATIDDEVRQAFKEIEQARSLTVKKEAYQTQQVSKLLDNLKRLSKGDLVCDMEVSEADQDTQDIYELFSEISGNLHSSIDTIKGYIAEMTYFLGGLAEGNLTQEIDSEYQGNFAALKESINKIITSLNDIFSEIATAGNQVASGTRQVSDGSQEISQGATEQASAIEQLTASVAQIAAQTKQNAMNANEANIISQSAQSAALTGNEQMKNMQTAMTEINESSLNISKIIKVIDDIAFQTNILALNAAVEAARAGVHGKGFAVVAEEVRNLAARSAQAAKETTTLIEGSMNKVNAGTKITNATADALSKIVENVQKTVDLVGRITAASNEQATSIAQVDKGIEQLSTVVQTNSATAEEAAAASEELSSQAELLKSMIAQFKLKASGSPFKESSAPAAVKQSTAKPSIALSDSEFGKY